MKGQNKNRTLRWISETLFQSRDVVWSLDILKLVADVQQSMLSLVAVYLTPRQVDLLLTGDWKTVFSDLWWGFVASLRRCFAPIGIIRRTPWRTCVSKSFRSNFISVLLPGHTLREFSSGWGWFDGEIALSQCWRKFGIEESRSSRWVDAG